MSNLLELLIVLRAQSSEGGAQGLCTLVSFSVRLCNVAGTGIPRRQVGRQLGDGGLRFRHLRPQRPNRFLVPCFAGGVPGVVWSRRRCSGCRFRSPLQRFVPALQPRQLFFLDSHAGLQPSRLHGVFLGLLEQ